MSTRLHRRRAAQNKPCDGIPTEALESGVVQEMREFVEEVGVVRIQSRVVGRQLRFYLDERIEGQRLRLLIEDTAARMGSALAEDITRDLELFFAKRGGRHAA